MSTRIHAACWLFGSTDTPTCRNQAINLWVSYIVQSGGGNFRSLIKYDSFANSIIFCIPPVIA